ncbi:CIS tube protein [Leptolyngbya ohadii]|uniref:CIS tube protein n=1 Tax=Leptolyngbya ohadii TaxID=1962290 RepID=UPI00117BA012|nr:hypothetical protein [Leptolyngbya ohadii]
MTIPADFVRAKFNIQSGKNQGTSFDVHFNPVSLQYTISNTMGQGQGNAKKQYVSQSTGKLTMDLIFDTTPIGEDVRNCTTNVARLMEPDETQVPPIVQFEWGTYTFQGMMESYRETIDFFAANGVPLRASINLTLSQQDKVFEFQESSQSTDTRESLQPEPVVVPNRSGQNATRLGTQTGNSRAGRAIAAANGQASMRFFAGGAIGVSSAVTLGAPVAFATGGAGASFGVGGGIGGSIGGGVGISGGIGGGIGGGISGGIGGGIGGGISGGTRIGGSASAGISAREGAFAGLRSPTSRNIKLDTDRLISRSESFSVTTDRDASFQLGGRATLEGSTSLSANVGASASLRTRIQFKEQ